MITALSMNPCIDLTLYIDKLNPGGSHRAKRHRKDVAGKAVNVVYALKNFGIPCRLLGFDYIENGAVLKEPLELAGISYDLLPVEGAIRTNIKIFEEDNQVMTEINQEGAYVPAEAVSALIEKTANVKTDLLILSGSLPQGLDDGVYGDIIKRVKAPVILDAYGPALSKGLLAGAYLIKPNLFELEQTFGVSAPSRESQISLCRDLLRQYAKLRAVCLSLGKDGALMIGRDEAFFSPALDITVRGVQGAGDSLVAGMAALLMESVDAPLDALLKHAVAAASASLIREGTLMAAKEGFDEMIERVEIFGV